MNHKQKIIKLSIASGLLEMYSPEDQKARIGIMSLVDFYMKEMNYTSFDEFIETAEKVIKATEDLVNEKKIVIDKNLAIGYASGTIEQFLRKTVKDKKNRKKIAVMEGILELLSESLNSLDVLKLDEINEMCFEFNSFINKRLEELNLNCK